MGSSLANKLLDNPARKQLIEHPLFQAIDRGEIDRSMIQSVLGQWWHPLHFFPDFMSGAVAAMPTIEAKSFLANILNEETGNGRAEDAHERLFIVTARNAGLDEQQVVATPPTEETRRLVEGYRDSVRSMPTALGFVYGTEVVDLVMVSQVNKALRHLAPNADLPWVDIHISQEPNHVAQANRSIDIGLTEEEERAFISAAESVWSLWGGMFASASRLAAEPKQRTAEIGIT
jgi:pyrroloquinoline quinone (PQQ) biosynthesis protein C